MNITPNGPYRPVFWYNIGMQKSNKIHKKYTENPYGYQLVLPLNLEVLVPDDDSVRLLDQILEGLDYSSLIKASSFYGRNYGTSRITLFKILVYAYSQGIYSSRNIEKACRRDINFKWLLKGEPVPDHNAIWRFMNGQLDSAVKDLFVQLVKVLAGMDQIPFENLFVDGTKIEADANRYTFVWRKAVEKNEAKLKRSVIGFLEEIKSVYDIKIDDGLSPIQMLEKVHEWLSNEKEEQGLAFAEGKGNHKCKLQKDIEKANEYIKRQKKYDYYNSRFNGRNSLSKTDTDATFMILKEDHMRNAQLKPAYNVQFGIENEYVTNIQVSSDRNDVNALKSFLTDIEKCYGRKPGNVIADAGYESEENYSFMEKNGYGIYIKPQNHEQGKKRSYARKYPGRVENMTYDEANDQYICAGGKTLVFTGNKERQSKSGYLSTLNVYECTDCSGCSIRSKCTKSKYNKQLEVAVNFHRLRKESYANITSEHGIMLRMNRSIQAEGAIGVLKQDYGFRRFLRRGTRKVESEILLLCMGFNINKLHNKIQGDRLDQYLYKTA